MMKPSQEGGQEEGAEKEWPHDIGWTHAILSAWMGGAQWGG